MNLCLSFILVFCQWIIFFFKILFLFIFRERGREVEREGEKHQCERGTSIACPLHTCSRGPGQQPGHVPWPGMEPVTIWFARRHPIHWATPVKTILCSFKFCSYSNRTSIHRLSLVKWPLILLRSILHILLYKYVWRCIHIGTLRSGSFHMAGFQSLVHMFYFLFYHCLTKGHCANKWWNEQAWFLCDHVHVCLYFIRLCGFLEVSS